MSEVVHGGIATATKQFGFFHFLSREGRLMKKFYNLKKMGSSRYTPAVVIAGDHRPIEVTKAPNEPDGFWVLYDGRQVKTSEILELENARWLVG